MGYPIDGYWKEEHPLQQQIIAIVAALSELEQSEIRVGIDGCGVPVFALPLKHMALTYLKLACPDTVQDARLREAIQKMTNV